MYPIFASSLDLATVDVSPTADFDPRLAWQEEDLLMNSFGAFLKRKFGGRTQRVSIDAGFTCPNVDGAVARGGCNFCDNRSFSPSRRVRLRQVSEQLQSGMKSVRYRYDKVASFIAYFQPATNINSTHNHNTSTNNCLSQKMPIQNESERHKTMMNET